MMSDGAEDRKARTGALFSGLARAYDPLGTFAHFGRQLVSVVGIEASQRVLDVASGRGAVLFPAAEHVGDLGEVVGIDLAEGMAEATNEEAARLGLSFR